MAQQKKNDDEGGKAYDLTERTFAFAKRVRAFIKMLPHNLANVEDARQLVRASGSVGANYIEACEALGKKDFAMRVKISRKEAKESHYFLRLLDTGDKADIENERQTLVREAWELNLIFGSIVRKSE